MPRHITPEDMDALFCSPDFIKRAEASTKTSAEVFQEATEEEAAFWIQQGRDNKKRMTSIPVVAQQDRSASHTSKESRRTTGVLSSALRMSVAFAVAGFVSALASIFDFAGPCIVLLMLAHVQWPPYLRAKYEGTGQKYDYLKLVLTSLPFFAVILITLVPHVANYISAWGLLWGMAAVFMSNMLYRQFRLCGHIGRWLAVMLLCWFYAYVSDKTLRSLWGPSPYDLETVFYGMHAFFGAAVATTVAISYRLVRRTPRCALLVFLLAAAGFFLGDLLSVFILKPFSLVLSNPAQAAVVCIQTVSAFFGGLAAGIAVGICPLSQTETS